MTKQKLVLFDIDYTLFKTDIFKQTKRQKHSVYDEIYNVLEELSKVAKLGVFSEGDITLQKTKLRQTKIHKYFPPKYTHIVEIKDQNLKKILKKYKNNKLFLVDDKLTILHTAKKILPSIFTIWVKRGIYAQKQKPIPGFEPDAEVTDLQEVVKIITNPARARICDKPIE